MTRLRSIVVTVVLAAALVLPGCAPTVLCLVETEVRPDYTVFRTTRLEAHANPRFPGQVPRLADYFQFPPAELYDNYVVQQDKVLFAGDFDSFEMIPSDLVRNTPGAANQSGNLFSFRVMDLVLFVLADFDETLTDIVTSQEDGEAALSDLIRLLVPEIVSVLNAKYGAKYDMSRLESWLLNDLPVKLRRVYAGAWAIHSAKRSGVTSPGEEYEFYMFLKAEAKREGLELAEPGTPDMQQENVRRLKEYGIRVAQNLVIPRQGGNVTGQELANIAVDELVAAIQKAITARHGSVNNFVAKIAALVPRAFGAYLTGTMMPIYMLPETTYQYRLRIPGTVIQSNGVREINGDVLWNFTDRDLAFTGQSMWARTIFIREPVVYALGLRGFPASLGDVDRLFGFCLTPNGIPREGIIKALSQSAMNRNLGPLESLAADTQSEDSAAAKGILDLFERHRRAQTTQPRTPSAASPQQEPAAPAPSPTVPEAPPPASPAAQQGQPSGRPETVNAASPALNAPIPEHAPVPFGNAAPDAGTAPAKVPSLEPIQPLPANGTPAATTQTAQPANRTTALTMPPLPEPDPAAMGNGHSQQPAAPSAPFGGIEPPALPPPVGK